MHTYIHTIFLKKFPELCVPLCDLFNMSIQQGIVPKAWKIANVIPIFKGKGSALDVKNYRPISLTNVFCKTLEKLIRNRIIEYLENNHLLSPCQSGFRAGSSTLTQLTKAQSFIVDSINQLRCVDGIYTDLSKAFDTISHTKLIIKLQAYGIQGNMLNWIKSFLSDRYQSVSINSILSSKKPCISGSPQGSVLSPLFFLLFINDLPDCITHSQILLYADDAKLLKAINCRLYCFHLQQDLDALVHWCSTWQLALNISKCLYTRFGLTNKPSFNYSISGTASLQVTSVNDLGVLFDSKLDFSAQCHKIAAKGYSRSNMILKCFYSKDRSLLCKLFCTFVRPVLEYNSPIWSPHYIKDIKTIEKFKNISLKISKVYVINRIMNVFPYLIFHHLNVAVPMLILFSCIKFIMVCVIRLFKSYLKLLPLLLILILSLSAVILYSFISLNLDLIFLNLVFVTEL